MRARPGAIAAACAVLAVTRGALAQAPEGDDKAAAEALYEEGHTLDAQGNYLQACPKYAESLRLDPGIGVMLHLASCWEKAGKPASAWAEYREAEQVAGRAGDSRSEVARKHAEALEGRLFRLTIQVQQAPSGEEPTIVRDGETVGRAQWGAPLPVDPGPHTIVAMAGAQQRWQTTFVAGDQPGALTITVPPLSGPRPPGPVPAPASPLPAETPAPGSPWTSQRIAAVAVGAAGVVGIGVGTYFGVLTKVKLDQSNSSGCQPDNHCTSGGASLRNDALTAGHVSTVAFAVGLSALAGGAALWLTAPRGHAVAVGMSAGPGYGGAVVGGAW